MRENLTPYTFMFSAEQTAPQTMKYNVPQWNKWLEKEPKKIIAIVNIPRKPDENAKDNKDPRVLILDMSSSFMHHKELYVEAKPGSIVRIYKEPTDPEKAAEQKKKEAAKKAKEKKVAEKKEAENIKKKETGKMHQENAYEKLTSRKKG